jgi:energy-coupling factor transporter ATP-binding protein EcfA2
MTTAAITEQPTGDLNQAVIRFVGGIVSGIREGAIINVTAPPGFGKSVITRAVLNGLGRPDIPIHDQEAVPIEHRLLYGEGRRPLVWTSVEPLIPGSTGVDPIFGKVRVVQLEECLSHAYLRLSLGLDHFREAARPYQGQVATGLPAPRRARGQEPSGIGL